MKDVLKINLIILAVEYNPFTIFVKTYSVTIHYIFFLLYVLLFSFDCVLMLIDEILLISIPYY